MWKWLDKETWLIFFQKLWIEQSLKAHNMLDWTSSSRTHITGIRVFIKCHKDHACLPKADMSIHSLVILIIEPLEGPKVFEIHFAPSALNLSDTRDLTFLKTWKLYIAMLADEGKWALRLWYYEAACGVIDTLNSIRNPDLLHMGVLTGTSDLYMTTRKMRKCVSLCICMIILFCRMATYLQNCFAVSLMWQS